MSQVVDTRVSPDFRALHFSSIDDCVAEVQRIMLAEREGKLQTSGNWTAGQNMGHVASWIDYAYDGFPVKPPPFFIRWILKLQLRKMLKTSMPRGVRIPGLAEGTVGIEPEESMPAAERLLRSLERLRSQPHADYPSPAFGKMSHEDRIALNLRHAELHLGFLRY